MHSSFRDIAEDTLTNSKVMTKRSWQQKLALKSSLQNMSLELFKKLKKPLKEKFLNLIYDEIAIDAYKE